MYISKDFPENLDITVTCASGVEKVVKSELKRLGYQDVPALNGTLSFNGTALDIARLNVFLRSADRVYVKIAEFNAQTFDELFEIMSLRQLSRHTKPIAIYNINGYYDDIKNMMGKAVSEGFVTEKCKSIAPFFSDAEKLLCYLETEILRETPEDFSRLTTKEN